MEGNGERLDDTEELAVGVTLTDDVRVKLGRGVEQPAVINGILADVQADTFIYWNDDVPVRLLGVLADSTKRIGDVVIPSPQLSARMRM